MISAGTKVGRDDVAAHYDDLDRFYKEIWGEHIHHGFWKTRRDRPEVAVRQLVDLVAERAGVAHGSAVCDVGCGYGGTARALASQFNAKVTALTISRAQYEYACSVPDGSPNVQYLLRDWAQNGLPPASFDVVISIESSEHMADKAVFMAEVARVLKPGGRFVVCAWLAKPRPRRWETRYLLEPICREGRLPGMGSVDEYHELVSAAGLQAVGFEDISRNVKRTWPICVGRALKGLIRDPSYRRFLFRSGSPDRIFALTLFRIWLAYETGSMRYGILTAVKPSPRSQSACQREQETAAFRSAGSPLESLSHANGEGVG